MDAAAYGVEQGGCRCLNLGPYLISSSFVVHDVRVGDVGGDNLYWESVGSIPSQGGPQDDREATSDRKVRHMSLYTTGGRDVGAGITGGADLHLPHP